MKRTVFALFVLAIGLGLVPAPVPADDGGMVTGTMGIRTEDGQVAHGDFVRVLLVTRETLGLMPTDDLPESGFERTGAINSLHSDFYIKIQQQLSDPDFVANSTLTMEDGSFLFRDVPAGAYFIVVTFPSTIDGSKVAWQVPVTVMSGEPVTTVALTEDNILFPVHRR